jgi:hypothetical protein
MRVADLATDRTGETVTKSDREIMEILESYDLTRCAHSAAQLAGCDAKTVKRYVALRDAGGGVECSRSCRHPAIRLVAARTCVSVRIRSGCRNRLSNDVDDDCHTTQCIRTQRPANAQELATDEHG